MIRVTRHAIQRFVERVAPVNPKRAREMILTAIAKTRADDTGAPYVKLGTGQRIVIEGDAVVTVLAKGTTMGLLGRAAHLRRVERRRDADAIPGQPNDHSVLYRAEIGNLGHLK